MFRDNALKRPLGAGFEQGSTVTIELFAELNAAIGIISDQVLQNGTTLRERPLSKVFAVEMQQVEGVEDDAVGSGSYGRLKRLEVRTAIAILDYRLTINDC